MKWLFVSATPFEIAPLTNFLQAEYKQLSPHLFQKNKIQIEILITGVGMPLTAYHLGKKFAENKYDLAINVGIAGAFNRKLNLGDVVNVISEQFGDLGIEEADGSFSDLFENKLLESNSELFTNSKIINPNAAEYQFLPKASSLSINKVHGYPASITSIQNKYAVDIESMEGAAFFMACKLAKVPFLQIRSISNYVEKRNREAWNLPLAIENLNKVLLGLLRAVGQ